MAKVQKAYLRRLEYTRSRFLAGSQEEVNQVTAAYEIQNQKLAQRQRVLNLLRFPWRCIRYLRRKISSK